MPPWSDWSEKLWRRSCHPAPASSPPRCRCPSTCPLERRWQVGHGKTYAPEWRREGEKRGRGAARKPSPQRGAMELGGGTWLDREELAYDRPLSRSPRWGEARLRMPAGALVAVRLGVPDTYFSIPALHAGGRGFVSIEDGVLVFTPEQEATGRGLSAHRELSPGEIGWSAAIHRGDKVTFLDYAGKERTGKAVMPSSSGGWVLNMGGWHGQPQVVHDDQILRVKAPRRRDAPASGQGARAPSPSRILGAVEAGDDAFWLAVHGHFPEARSSEMPNVVSVALSVAEIGAVKAWVARNVPALHLVPSGRAARGAPLTLRLSADEADALLDVLGRAPSRSRLLGTAWEKIREARRQHDLAHYRGPWPALGGRAARKAQLPIGVHSVGFPKAMTARQIKSWLKSHDFDEPLLIDRGKGSGEYAWARLRNVSPLYTYRTDHWDTSVGRVAVRFAIHKRRAAQRDVEREVAATRRRVA